jgi:hypothetical protein
MKGWPERSLPSQYQARKSAGRMILPALIEWARQDLNLRPFDYESSALTN